MKKQQFPQGLGETLKKQCTNMQCSGKKKVATAHILKIQILAFRKKMHNYYFLPKKFQLHI